jgi:hypothetical protein
MMSKNRAANPAPAPAPMDPAWVMEIRDWCCVAEESETADGVSP